MSIEDRNRLAVAAAASLAATIAEREMAPYVSEYEKGNLEKNSLTEAERSDERRAIGQRKRKLIEQVFGSGPCPRMSIDCHVPCWTLN
ncbi:MAG: hypothetical protein ACYCO5_00790 [Acidobacteriaceae bacterium]